MEEMLLRDAIFPVDTTQSLPTTLIITQSLYFTTVKKQISFLVKVNAQKSLPVPSEKIKLWTNFWCASAGSEPDV